MAEVYPGRGVRCGVVQYSILHHTAPHQPIRIALRVIYYYIYVIVVLVDLGLVLVDLGLVLVDLGLD